MADTDPAAPTFDDATSALQTQLDPQAALERLQMRRVQRAAQDVAAYRVVELVRDLRPAQILEATEPTVLVSLREWEALRDAAAEVPERPCTDGAHERLAKLEELTGQCKDLPGWCPVRDGLAVGETDQETAGATATTTT